MSETRAFRERLKGVLEIGIEHTQQHSEDLRRLGLEAGVGDDTGVAEGLLEAAELAQAVASKLKEAMGRVG